MPGGFNTDVPCDGVVLHVQTEDRGPDNPVIESLVYVGGQVLHQERSSTADVPGDADEVQKRLERQHRDVVRRARHGEYQAGPRPTLDELLGGIPPLHESVARALREDGAGAPLHVAFTPVGSGALAGRLAVLGGDGKPVHGAEVNVRLVGVGLPPAVVWSGVTGMDGFAVLAAPLPGGVGAAAVIRATHDGVSASLRVGLAQLYASDPIGPPERVPLEDDESAPTSVQPSEEPAPADPA